jgi:ElaA protein
MVTWKFIPFAQLQAAQLYAILALREEIFTFEQHCSDKDLDGLDQDAVHVVGVLGGERDISNCNPIIATARILPPGAYKHGKVSFGRLAIKKEFRGKGYGDTLLEAIQQYIADKYGGIPIEISSQLYLKSFYEKHGFIAQGEVYSEGGIPHIAMVMHGYGAQGRAIRVEQSLDFSR